MKSEQITNFKSIENISELISYLSNTTYILKDKKVVSHYTNIKAAFNIISENYWYLGSPKNMNDGLELQQGLNTRNDIFFSSFMAEQNESIAMWSMYAQPWEDGVMISIPIKEFKQWIKDTKIAYSIDPKTKKPNKDIFVNLNKDNILITKVAYYNQNTKTLSCGGRYKDNLLKSIDDPLLIGYIKDSAWAYEKEIRLRVDLETDVNYDGIAINVPDYIIKSMIITKGPRFKEDLINRLKAEFNQNIKTESSLFYNKLNYTPCDGCTYKNNENFICNI